MLKFHELKVSQVDASGNAGIRIALAIPDDLKDAMMHQPGQHLVLLRKVAGDEFRRSYSIISAPGDRLLRLAIRRHEQGVVSQDLCANLKPGELVKVLEPNGSFQLRGDTSQKVVAFAAGSGITPILGLAEGLLGLQKIAQFDLFYCNQNMARTLCADEVLALKNRYPEKFAVHFLMTREPQEFELLNGRLDSEKLDTFCTRVVNLTTLDQAFLSGPGDMMANLAKALVSAGMDAGKIHSEHYSIESVTETEANTGAASAETEKTAVATDQVLVEALIDGRRREFPLEEGESLLEAGLNAGVELPFSCCAGVCSTCRTKVIEGEVVMDENYALEDWEVEQGYVLACQSHPTTPKVVLDYDER